ncbi:uncharacterized [Tachysurus ichikawai]
MRVLQQAGEVWPCQTLTLGSHDESPSLPLTCALTNWLRPLWSTLSLLHVLTDRRLLLYHGDAASAFEHRY